jgi:hypothetical protein
VLLVTGDLMCVTGEIIGNCAVTVFESTLRYNERSPDAPLLFTVYLLYSVLGTLCSVLCCCLLCGAVSCVAVFCVLILKTEAKTT